MTVAVDFLVESVASLVGAFAGVFLALVAERRTRRSLEQRQRDEVSEEYARTRHVVLGSVVKNAAEASRLQKQLALAKAPTLVEAGLEVSVWDAARDGFIRLCPSTDERVHFAQFFDGVRRLSGQVDFLRGLQASVVTAGLDRDDPELRQLMLAASDRIASLSEDVRLTGVMLVADFGDGVHRRMLGITPEAE